MIIHSDCILAMSEMEPSSIDAIVTDPPYGLGFMGKDWDAMGGAVKPRCDSPSPAMVRSSNPFFKGRGAVRTNPLSMQQWHQQWASEALRVLKPGGSLLSFGGTRTFHRLTCGLEDAGFIIKDCLMYLYGAGFPKAQDAANMIRKRYCRCGEQETEHDLRPVQNPDIPQGFDASDKSGEVLFEGLQESGLSEPGAEAGNGDARVTQSRMEGRRDVLQAEGQLQGHSISSRSRVGVADVAERRLHNGTPSGNGDGHGAAVGANGSCAPSRQEPNEQRTGESGALALELGAQESGVGQVCPDCGKPICPDGLAEYWDGYKVGGLKPAFEPIVFAVKPPEGAWIDNVLKYGTGAVNVDECRIGTEAVATLPTCRHNNPIYAQDEWTKNNVIGEYKVNKGRFPANLLLSHTPDCREVGTKRVKTGTAVRKNIGISQKGMNFAFGNPGPEDDVTYADPDGYETVSAWECAEDCPVRLLDEQSGVSSSQRTSSIGGFGAACNVYGKGKVDYERGFSDTGGASRFFYTSKASNRDSYNDHPTLKPTDLIEWLIRLVTRPGQLVLDPFMGSGTTLVAAIQCGREAIGIEQDRHYCDIAERRTTDGAQQGMF